jgi:hypothetical protein
MACCGSGVESAVAEQPSSPGASTTTDDVVAEKSIAPSTPAKGKAPEAAVGSGAPSVTTSTSAPVVTETTAPSQEQAVQAPSGSSASPQSNVSVREEPKPGWATAEKSNTGTTATADSPATKAPGARPAKNVPAAFVSGTRKDQEISSGVQDRIAGLKASGLATQNTGGKRMKTPRIITDTKESWDREGNITRELTRYITEPDGTKRTEKETIYIPAAEAQQAQQ